MKISVLHILILLAGAFSAAETNAQGFQNKKATGTQTLTLRLTRPAATQVDMAATANSFLNKSQDQQTTQTISPTSEFTVTEVTNTKQSAPTETNAISFQPATDKIQVITLSKA